MAFWLGVDTGVAIAEIVRVDREGIRESRKKI
jgi:hypothetical protein